MNRILTTGTVSRAHEQTAKPYDLEAIVSLQTIREHTKTDDVPSVTDDMLRLYRRLALEAAELYTGLLLSGRRVVSEEVNPPRGRVGDAYMRNPFFYHTTQYMISEPIAYWYGRSQQAPSQIGAQVGSRRVKLPIEFEDFGIGCCNPCADTGGSRLQYVAGYASEQNIPAAVIVGSLKYIAHAIEHAGDSSEVVPHAGLTRDTLLETNNPAVASGAIEIWRMIVSDAI